MPDERIPPTGTVKGGVWSPAETTPVPEPAAEPEEVSYVWRRGESADPPAATYVTPKNGIPVKRVSDYGDAFDQGLALALAYETSGDVEGGKYHHVEGDRGGPTKYGISEYFNPGVDIKNLTLDKAVKIYREKYWPEAEKLPKSAPDLQALYFEGFMNMGAGATKSLQRAIGADADGVFGKESLQCLDRALDEKGEKKIIKEYLWQRSEYYRRIWQNDPSQEKFKKGWQNRVDDVGFFHDDVLSRLA
jgi:hypothetical protein